MRSFSLCLGALGLVLVLSTAASAADAAKPTTVVEAMAPFKPIAEDTLKLIKAGDIPAAKAKITELETAWDKAEADLKPKYPAEWKSIDKTIDKALDDARKPEKPDVAKAAASVQDVVAKLTKPSR